MHARDTRVLILCKTSPTPSSKHSETSCVASMEEDGSLIRLFRVAFRLIDDESQFMKWRWVKAKVSCARGDNRPESHNVYSDTIKLDGVPMPAGEKGWASRRELLGRAAAFCSFRDLDRAREAKGATLGLLRPHRIVGLDITPAGQPDWTTEEIAKLRQFEGQANMFEPVQKRRVTTLKKVPFDFHHRYECEVDGELVTYRHKISDWEAGALYWRCWRSHGAGWEEPFGQKYERELPSRDLTFLMGTLHRFPDQWLIVSVFAPPKPPPAPESPQLALGL
jgi:hypothetical protein